ncbi:peptide/nickel transport system ATP-binding protein [Caldalkalibacillus uzonensis]|uniref:Peptide/nickel transport system ATP-binding protein n=1 Tax=Caldalkalibacillus uzonensis TaxID=353224 RepID=A0ABU0CRJ9_9BACI|nr:dipeptide/oligopeptide/nickel ABC transporter ATP-binding protein [Caldalkalibacillus uzonensis]MDQ0339051.1 peptide/nickel transport system ATP-binding protein [Caldalkalibacillus uzonensis]
MMVLNVKHLTKTYPSGVTAVDDISFQLEAGHCLGIVGESGSGKSTLARLLLALERPDRGEVFLEGVPLYTMRREALRLKRQHIQAVFQDPHASLNPSLTVMTSVLEPLDNFPHAVPSFLKPVSHDRRKLAAALLHMVGLGEDILDRYPHQLSGGQKQRVAIARGISINPKIVVCDEPTASLDVSVQAQVLNLLKSLQEELGMAYVFISHDLAAVRFMCDRVIVMKAGRIVDQCAAGALFKSERHPYTRQLLAASS